MGRHLELLARLLVGTREDAALGRRITLQVRVSPTTSEDLLAVLASQPRVRRVRVEPLP
jgi:hypothetical protein